jgi:hypothetical protein
VSRSGHNPAESRGGGRQSDSRTIGGGWRKRDRRLVEQNDPGIARQRPLDRGRPPLDSAQKRRRPPPMAVQLGEAVVDRRRQGFDAARVPSLSPLVRSAERRAGRRPVAIPALGA